MELNWDIEIAELEAYFKTIDHPDSIVVKPYMKIVDVQKFISSHLTTVKQYSGRTTFLPYLDRLRSLKIFYEENREAYPKLEIIIHNNRVA